MTEQQTHIEVPGAETAKKPTPEEQTELEQLLAELQVLRAEVARLEQLEARTVPVVLDLRATITRLMGELKVAIDERDEARRDRDVLRLVHNTAAKIRLARALANLSESADEPAEEDEP